MSLLSLWLRTGHVVALCEFIATVRKVMVYTGKKPDSASVTYCSILKKDKEKKSKDSGKVIFFNLDI